MAVVTIKDVLGGYRTGYAYGFTVAGPGWGQTMNDIHLWCWDHFGESESWLLDLSVVWFVHPEQAVEFKLRWM